MTQDQLKQIRWIGFDVDGTLTNGTISVDDHGLERKAFHIGDGLGIRLALSAGLKIYLISGRPSDATRHRFKMLTRDQIILAVDDKASVIESILQREGVAPSQAAFMGDDLNDLPAFGAVGMKIAPANAVEAVKKRADYVTTASGGNGAAREFIDLVLTAQGRYEEIVAEYFATLKSPQTSILA